MIAWRIYGRTNDGLVEAMLEANSSIADQGPVLPAGLTLIIPDAPAPAATQQVRLWG